MPFFFFLTAKEESQEVNFEEIGYIKASRHCHVFYPVFKIIVWFMCVCVIDKRWEIYMPFFIVLKRVEIGVINVLLIFDK